MNWSEYKRQQEDEYGIQITQISKGIYQIKCFNEHFTGYEYYVKYGYKSVKSKISEILGDKKYVERAKAIALAARR